MLQYIRVALSTQATHGVAAKRNGAKVVLGFAVPSGIYPWQRPSRHGGRRQAVQDGTSGQAFGHDALLQWAAPHTMMR